MGDEAKTTRIAIVVVAIFLAFIMWNTRACIVSSHANKLECLTTTDRDSRDCWFN